MAVTLRRLALPALVLTAVLIPVLKPGTRPVPTESERRLERVQLLRQRLNVAGVRWGALAERDSGALPAMVDARSGRPGVQLRGFGAAAVAPEVNRILDDLWSRLGPVDSAVRVALLIYNDDPYTFRQQVWGGYSGASISLGNGGATCVVLLRGRLQRDGRVGVGKGRLEDALGPCTLLAGFGPPGPTLERWLGTTRYLAAGSTAWLSRSRSFIDGGRGAMPWMAIYDYGSYDDDWPPIQGLMSTGSLAREIAQLLSPPYELGAHGLRCTEGDVAACRRGVLDTTVISEATRGLPPDLTYAWSLLDYPLNWTLGTPRPPGEWWLSDLIRDQGREKFARFWTSSASFEQAFQVAFGEDLGAWTHRWSVRQWENSWFEKYSPSPRLLGATLKPSWPLLALGWSGVALMLTAWVARRRQVT